MLEKWCNKPVNVVKNFGFVKYGSSAFFCTKNHVKGFKNLRKKKFITSQEAKDLLKKNTDELIGRGGFGSPTFFYKEKMFFGNDRLHLLEEAISKNLI